MAAEKSARLGKIIYVVTCILSLWFIYWFAHI
jgi:hypothetical protein